MAPDEIWTDEREPKISIHIIANRITLLVNWTEEENQTKIMPKRMYVSKTRRLHIIHHILGRTKFALRTLDIITNGIMENLIKIQNRIDFEEFEANIQLNVSLVLFMHDFIVFRFGRSECKIRGTYSSYSDASKQSIYVLHSFRILCLCRRQSTQVNDETGMQRWNTVEVLCRMHGGMWELGTDSSQVWNTQIKK